MCVALFAGLPAFADFEKGWDASQKGDHATALHEWKPLAENGNASAQYNLGLMYDNGWGVPQDYQGALKWYKLSAEQGNEFAQYNLGNYYAKGQGVPKDYHEAVKLFMLAAEQGHVSAQGNLSVMYANGQGVPKDYVFAYMWANLAASKDGEKGIEIRDGVAKHMTSEQIAEAQKLARECFAKDYKGC